jgi:hypothetical protein
MFGHLHLAPRGIINGPVLCLNARAGANEPQQASAFRAAQMPRVTAMGRSAVRQVLAEG